MRFAARKANAGLASGDKWRHSAVLIMTVGT